MPLWLVTTLFVVAGINFAGFFLFSWYFGGDALSGHEAGGRYFLAHRQHLTEVSGALYRFSLWHTLSVFVTHALAILTWLLATRKGRTIQG